MGCTGCVPWLITWELEKNFWNSSKAQSNRGNGRCTRCSLGKAQDLKKFKKLRVLVCAFFRKAPWCSVQWWGTTLLHLWGLFLSCCSLIVCFILALVWGCFLCSNRLYIQSWEVLVRCSGVSNSTKWVRSIVQKCGNVCYHYNEKGDAVMEVMQLSWRLIIGGLVERMRYPLRSKMRFLFTFTIREISVHFFWNFTMQLMRYNLHYVLKFEHKTDSNEHFFPCNWVAN